MNTKSFLSRENFIQLFTKLENLGFRAQSKEEIIARVRNMELARFLKKREGIETIYEQEVRGKWIFVLTTYSEYLQQAKVHDEGWVLIIDPRNVKPFFSFPVRRTSERFFTILLSWTETFIDIVQNWPKVQGTDEDRLLTLVPGELHRGHFVHPNKSVRHFKMNRPILVTDLDLDPKNKKFLVKYPDRYDKRRDKEQSRGINRTPQRVIKSNRKKVGLISRSPKGIHLEYSYNDGNHAQ